jgi:molybdopterin converting factor small subunit
MKESRVRYRRENQREQLGENQTMQLNFSNMKVKFFARAREHRQTSEEDVEATTVQELIEKLQFPFKFLVSVNEEIVQDYTQELADTDTICIIPPVSGG